MPREGVHRAFDLKHWSYFLDFALAPVAVSGLTIFAARCGLPVIAIMIAEFSGVVLWTLAEYWIHRSVFHGNTRFEPMHQMHHALPKDMIGVATWLSFAGFSLVWLLAAAASGIAAGSAMTAGFIAGYLFYCVIHVAMHHARSRGFGRYGEMMLRLHHAHHRGARANFGVSSPIWDLAFRTYRKEA